MRIFPNGVLPAVTAADEARARTPVTSRRGMSLQTFLQAFHITRGAGIVSTSEAWRNSVWVRRCVTSIADAIAQLQFELKVKKTDQPKENHPVLELIEAPSDYLSTYDLWYQTVLILQLFGESFWLLSGGSKGKPQEITIFHPEAVRDEVKNGKLLGWRFQLPNGAWSGVIDILDVVHFRIYDPGKPFRGTSPLESAGLATSGDIAAQKYNLDFFNRGAVPDGIVWTEQDIDTTTADEVKERWKQNHQGKSHEIDVLGSGFQYQATHVTSRDSEFIDGRKLNREEIAAAFSVPMVVLGLLEGATYSNTDGQLKTFWQIKLKPTMALLASSIDKHLVRDKTLKSGFDLSEVVELQEAHKDKADTASKYFAMGWPLNQINEVLKLGFQPVEHGDVGYLPFSLQPVDQIGAEDEDEDAIEGELIDDDKEPKQLPAGEKTFDLERMLARMQRRMIPAIARADKSINIQSIIDLIKDDDERLKSISSSFYRQAYQIGHEQMAELLGLDVKFDLKDPRAKAFIEEKILRITDINDTTAEKIRKILTAGVDEGQSVDQIAKSIKEAFNDFSDTRSVMIARTEVAQAVNGGRFGLLEEEGADSHEWLNSADDRVRESHIAEDGNVVKVGESFPITRLLYPCDPNGDPEEIIQCRCISLPAEASRAVRIANRKQFARQTVAAWVPTEKRFQKALKKYFFTQRASILKAIS